MGCVECIAQKVTIHLIVSEKPFAIWYAFMLRNVTKKRLLLQYAIRGNSNEYGFSCYHLIFDSFKARCACFIVQIGEKPVSTINWGINTIQ